MTLMSCPCRVQLHSLNAKIWQHEKTLVTNWNQLNSCWTTSHLDLEAAVGPTTHEEEEEEDVF